MSWSALPMAADKGRENFMDGAFQSFDQMFDQWVRKTPSAVAVEDDENSYSYLELDEYASRISWSLRASGVKPGDVVAMYMPRAISIWPVILGIFRVGAVYLPVEPNWPSDRLSYVVAKSNCSHLICWRIDELPRVLRGYEVSVFSEMVGHTTMLPMDQRVRHSSAYIIFTSGSTGRPKGVEIGHRALSNLLCGMAMALSFDSSFRQLCITSFAFDLVMPDLFLPLISGACCVLTSTELSSDGEGLANKLENAGITVLQATPHTYQQLLESGWAGRAVLKALIGGDKVSLSLADKLVPKISELWHCYGPTEATVWASMGRHYRGKPLRLGPVLPGYNFAVINENGMLLDKSGSLGELYIGGIGLALGYTHDEKRTDVNFTNIDIGDGSERFYRTGDVVRLHTSATEQIEYVGRVDNQVKVRGFRVELGEIEQVALSVVGVNEFVAVMSSDIIIGFYMPGKYSNTNLELAIRRQLSQRLPWYMLPAKLKLVSQFPLTDNRKIDRVALASHDFGETAILSGSNELHRREVRQCWDVICPGWSSDNDNFFDLGGDSLRAVNLLVALEDCLLLELPLSFVYAYPSVDLMVEALSGLDGLVIEPVANSAEILCLQHGEGVPLYFFHPIGGGIYHYQVLADCLNFNQRIYGIQAQGFDGSAPLYQIVDMAKKYCEMILAYSPSEPVRLAGGSMGGVLAIETAKQLVSKGCDVEKVFLMDAMASVSSTESSQDRNLAAKIWHSTFARVDDLLLSLRANWTFIRGRRLSNTLRYGYLQLVNHRALGHYFSSLEYRQPYCGEVVLFRRPIEAQGIYSDPLLGWGEVLSIDPIVIYLDGSHEKFIEAQGFQDIFRSAYY